MHDKEELKHIWTIILYEEETSNGVVAVLLFRPGLFSPISREFVLTNIDKTKTNCLPLQCGLVHTSALPVIFFLLFFFLFYIPCNKSPLKSWYLSVTSRLAVDLKDLDQCPHLMVLILCCGAPPQTLNFSLFHTCPWQQLISVKKLNTLITSTIRETVFKTHRGPHLHHVRAH